MTSKSTKRALVSSALAIVLCLAMLIGSTFAWFTDTASTGVNKIQAGNLKMEVTYKNTKDGSFDKVTEQTNVFKEDTLWEPGHVEYAVLNVKNVGSLALKYQLGINIASETGSTNVNGEKFNLSDYIKFAVVDGDKSGETRADLVAAAEEAGSKLINAGYTKENHLLAKTADAADYPSDTVTLVVWMPETVGNEANYAAAVAGVGDELVVGTAPEINLGISVVATQYTYESDSFDEKYDENATYPVLVSNQDELDEAISSNSKVNIKLDKAGDYALPSLENKSITITGTKETKINMVDKTNKATEVSFNGVTVNFGTADYCGFQHTGKLTYKDCAITGKQFLYGDEVEFDNCVFEQEVVDYNVWTYGAGHVLFKNCTFSCVGKSVLIYNEGSISGQTVEFQSCKFKASSPVDGKAAIEIDSSLLKNGATYQVIIDKSTADSVTGFGDGSNSHSSVWNNKNGEKATVIVGGETVLSAK